MKMLRFAAVALLCALFVIAAPPALAASDPNIGKPVTAVGNSGATMSAHGVYCPDSNGNAVPCNFGASPDGGNVTLGAKADPKSLATDTTPASGISLFKGIIDRLGALISALGSPLQAGGLIGNTGFAINGQLPAFASPPSVNVGQVGGSTVAQASGQTNVGGSGVQLIAPATKITGGTGQLFYQPVLSYSEMALHQDSISSAAGANVTLTTPAAAYVKVEALCYLAGGAPAQEFVKITAVTGSVVGVSPTPSSTSHTLLECPGAMNGSGLGPANGLIFSPGAGDNFLAVWSAVQGRASNVTAGDKDTIAEQNTLAIMECLHNGSTCDRQTEINAAVASGVGTKSTAIAPHSVAAGAIVPAVTTATGNTFKASPANLYGWDFTQGAAGGFFVFLNTSTVPASGATLSPIKCVAAAANQYVGRNNTDVPERYTTGLTVVSSTVCGTYTPNTPALMSVNFQ